MLWFSPITMPLFWVLSPLSGAILVWALITAPWQKLWQQSIRQHLWYGAVACLTLLWSFVHISVQGAFSLAPLLTTSLTLIFGFRLALVCGAVAMGISYWIMSGNPYALPLTWLTSIAIPSTITLLLLKFVTHLKIQNLFLYTLGVGFSGGLLSQLSSGASTLFILKLFQAPAFPFVWQNSELFFLLAFPEGFCNGTVVSSLAIMAPYLVKTYDDDFYLKD